jgi:hypothetical protein
MAKRIDREILTDLHISASLQNTRNKFLECFAMYVSMRSFLGPERVDTFYSHAIFKSVSTVNVKSMNILASEGETLQMGHRKQNGDFLKKWRLHM